MRMIRVSRSNKMIFILPAAAALLALSAIVKWPCVVRTPCYFSAAREWELLQDNPARLQSRLRNNALMRIESYTLLQFDRQDFIQLFLNPENLSGQTVFKDQPLGEIVSSGNRMLLADLQGQLDRARAGLQTAVTGEKESVRKEADEALTYAKTRHQTFLPQFDRNQKLHREKLISDEEWELSRNTEALLRQNVQLQEARLRIVQSGEKPEAVRMAATDVGRIEDQLKQLRDKISLGRILAPIAGVFSSSEGDSVLCGVSDVDSVVCTMIVRSDMIPYVRRGQSVVVRQRETGFREMGKVLAVNPKGVMVSGRSEFMATALLPNPGRSVLPGMTGSASVITDASSLLDRIRRDWNRSLGRSIF
jgi:hypothetical protein